jgi:hypothetical protein
VGDITSTYRSSASRARRSQSDALFGLLGSVIDPRQQTRSSGKRVAGPCRDTSSRVIPKTPSKKARPSGVNTIPFDVRAQFPPRCCLLLAHGKSLLRGGI